MSTSEKRFFESWRNADTASVPAYQRTLDHFSSPFIGGDVLDLGCGNTVYYNTQSVKNWVGLEYAAARIDRVRFLHGLPQKQSLISADARSLPLADESFDTVCAFFLLHHLARNNRSESADHVRQALKDAWRVLRPGGTLVVAENAPCALHWPYQVLFPHLYAWARRRNGTLLPYFWPQKDMLDMLGRERFTDLHHVELHQTEWTHQPVLGFSLPPLLDNRPVSVMTLYTGKKPS